MIEIIAAVIEIIAAVISIMAAMSVRTAAMSVRTAAMSAGRAALISITAAMPSHREGRGRGVAAGLLRRRANLDEEARWGEKDEDDQPRAPQPGGEPC